MHTATPGTGHPKPLTTPRPARSGGPPRGLAARLALALAAALALVAALGALPARAAFSGANGQVAWIEHGSHVLTLDNPWDEAPKNPLVEAANPEASGLEHAVKNPVSAPSFSPDGTRIAFTRSVDDGSLGKHAAVFVVDVDGTRLRQVTFPFDAQLDSCPTCDDGEASWDYSPVWVDDHRVDFIRYVAAGKDAPHYSQVASTVWQVDVDTGSGALVRHAPPSEGQFQGIVGAEPWTEPVAIFAAPTGFSLRGAKTNHVYASSATGIEDVDASPNGTMLAYATVTASGPAVHVLATDGTPVETFSLGLWPAEVRFSPDGNGLIVPGCADDAQGNQVCGYVTHRLPDPEGDVRPQDPVEEPYLASSGSPEAPTMPGNRANFDVQSQDPPIVYLPGFLGSEIECAGSKLWMEALPPLTLSPMRLGPDGESNEGCDGAGPNGKLVGSFLLLDVYGHAEEWLKKMNPAGGWAAFGWDWRKAPQASLDDLDVRISELLERPLALKQGVEKVSLVAHSYGGLLARTYIADPAHAKKVGRLLTVGTPYWGAPKTIFGVAFGIELPTFSPLDAMIRNPDLKHFMANLAGAYHLFPSDDYGPWLGVDGVAQDQAGVADFVASVGGNASVLGTALQHHREIDGFDDAGGTIDLRAVVGAGSETVEGVDIHPSEDGGSADVGVRWGNGDETVPARSAHQGPLGSEPLGDDVHVQYLCGVGHMRQTADAKLQGAYARYLLEGHTPRRLDQPTCQPQGTEAEFFGEISIPPPSASLPALHGAAARAAAGGNLGDAELEGDAQILRVPGHTIVESDGTRPLSFEAEGVAFQLTPLHGSSRGQALRYGPVSGEVVLAPRGDGTTEVTLDGSPLAGTPVEGGDPSPGGGSNEGGPSGGPDTGPGATGDSGPAADGAQPGPPRLGFGPLRRLGLRRGAVAVRLSCDRAGAHGTLTARVGKRTVGRAALAWKRAGAITVHLRLARPARRALAKRRRLPLRLTARVRSGDGQTASATASARAVARRAGAPRAR